MADSVDSALAREIHSPSKSNPTPPALEMSFLDMKELWLLRVFFEGLAQAALLYANQPRFSAVSAGSTEQFVDQFWDYLNALHDTVLGEIEARVPATQDDAELRASAMLAQMLQAEDFAGIAAVAGSVVERAT